MMDGDFAAAGRFTMADVSLAYAIKLALGVGLAEFVTPGMQAYFERVSAREVYVRAMDAQKQAEE